MRLPNIKRDKTQKTSIRNEIRDISTDPIVSDKITRKSHEQPFQNLKTQKKWTKYLKPQKLPKLNQDQIINLNSLATFKKCVSNFKASKR